MDILQLRNISSGVIQNAAKTSAVSLDNSSGNGAFESIFAAAEDNIKTTNGYLSDAENEEIFKNLYLIVSENGDQFKANHLFIYLKIFIEYLLSLSTGVTK